MTIYIILFCILIGLLVGLVIWIYRLFRLFKKGKKKSFTIQISILAILIFLVTWELHIFPLSKNFYIKNRTTELTGKSFWSWGEFDYEEISVRGEGYTLDIYTFNEEIAEYFKNPDNDFFKNFPPDGLADIKWTKTPIKEDEHEILEFVTPIYYGWEGEIIERQELIRQIASQSGAYYSYQDSGGTNFYLISPGKRLIIMINHNM